MWCVGLLSALQGALNVTMCYYQAPTSTTRLLHFKSLLVPYSENLLLDRVELRKLLSWSLFDQGVSSNSKKTSSSATFFKLEFVRGQENRGQFIWDNLRDFWAGQKGAQYKVV